MSYGFLLCHSAGIDAFFLDRYAHRIRKDGHTKVIEYSLVAKQKGIHRAFGIKRPNVLRDSRLEAQALIAKQQQQQNGKHANGDKVKMDVDAESSASSSSASEDESEDEEKADGMDVDGEDEADEDQEDDDAVGSVRGRQTERIVTPDEVRAHLRRLFVNHAELVSLIYAPHGPLAKATASRIPRSAVAAAAPDKLPSGRPVASADIFFMDVVSVPPSRFRPAATMGDQVFENPQNSLLNNILRQAIVVRDLNQRLILASQQPDAPELLGADGKPRVSPERMTTMLYESLIDLQVTVNSMMDAGKNPMLVKQGKLPTPGVKQLLEKKEGLFRKNMMVRQCRSSFISVHPSRASALTFCWVGLTRACRASVSTMPLVPSSRPMSTSRRTRLEFRPCLRASSRSRNRSRRTTTSNSPRWSSTVRTSTRERVMSRWKTAT